jgi:hypothetical protein
LASTSFGLTPEYKFELHKAMLITSHYSKGAFSVIDLYQMPVYLRNFYMKEFGELKKKESAEVKKSSR